MVSFSPKLRSCHGNGSHRQHRPSLRAMRIVPLFGSSEYHYGIPNRRKSDHLFFSGPGTVRRSVSSAINSGIFGTSSSGIRLPGEKHSRILTGAGKSSLISETFPGSISVILHKPHENTHENRYGVSSGRGIPELPEQSLPARQRLLTPENRYASAPSPFP